MVKRFPAHTLLNLLKYLNYAEKLIEKLINHLKTGLQSCQIILKIFYINVFVTTFFLKNLVTYRIYWRNLKISKMEDVKKVMRLV
jgi:hypothetical protein